MKVKLLLLLGALASLLAHSLPARSFTLSEQAKISVLTCAPGKELHAIYGHAALRVFDPRIPYDVVFNYGVFSFQTPNFVYRFASGQTDYMLGTSTFTQFCDEYIAQKRRIVEQDLNLTSAEKQSFFNFLLHNAQPEYRVYRYNFFYDNCATRIRDGIETHIDGSVVFPGLGTQSTFRTLIKKYHHALQWVNFGIDLVVAAPADRKASAYEEMFLPNYLMSHLYGSAIAKNGKKMPLVSGSRVVYKGVEQALPSSDGPAPFTVLLFITLVVVAVSILQYHKQNITAWPDYLMYGSNGLIGILLLWFTLFSEHPAMAPNFNLLWALPLNIIFAAVWTVKRWRPITQKYHVFMAAWLLLFCIASPFFTQQFNTLIYFFVAMLLSRSLLHVFVIFQKSKGQPARH